MADRNPSNRLTKTERREQARRERAELQRKMARARRNRRIAIAVLVAVGGALGAFALLRPSPAVADAAELLRAAPQAKQAAGCGEVETVDPYQPETQDQAHIGSSDEMPPLSRYTTTPPTSGPHNPVPLPAGVYSTPPAVDRVIHSLEHGGTVVWYSPDASSEQLDELRAFYDDHGEAGSRVIVAPYDYAEQGGAGQLPAGTQMALVAWHRMQTCERVSLPAAFDFTARYSFPAFGDHEYEGEAPEPGGSM